MGLPSQSGVDVILQLRPRFGFELQRFGLGDAGKEFKDEGVQCRYAGGNYGEVLRNLDA